MLSESYLVIYEYFPMLPLVPTGNSCDSSTIFNTALIYLSSPSFKFIAWNVLSYLMATFVDFMNWDGYTKVVCLYTHNAGSSQTTKSSSHTQYVQALLGLFTSQPTIPILRHMQKQQGNQQGAMWQKPFQVLLTAYFP